MDILKPPSTPDAGSIPPTLPIVFQMLQSNFETLLLLRLLNKMETTRACLASTDMYTGDKTSIRLSPDHVKVQSPSLFLWLSNFLKLHLDIDTIEVQNDEATGTHIPWCLTMYGSENYLA